MRRFSYFFTILIFLYASLDQSQACPELGKLATARRPDLDRVALHYQTTGSAADQNLMYAVLRPTIEVMARRLIRRLPPNIEIADLEAEGFGGMLEAATKFDPNKGANFLTYAQSRIRGAMLDFLRDTSEIPRLTLYRAKFLHECLTQFEITNARKPSPEELRKAIIQAVDMKRQDILLKNGRLPPNFESAHDLNKILATWGLKSPVSLENSGQPDSFNFKNTNGENNPRTAAEALSLFQWLVSQLREPVDRDIFRLHFGRGLKQVEVGRILDLSPGRISQRVKLIRERLVQVIWEEYPDMAARMSAGALIVPQKILMGLGLEGYEFELETVRE